MALTDTEITRTKSAIEPCRIADSGNLYFWVTPSGGKLWRWAYRFEGKQKLATTLFVVTTDVPLSEDRAQTLL